jgi:peptide/nickel transport system ATP-binding protein
VTREILTARGLRASYATHIFGVDREVKVVEDVNLSIRRNEVFGIAGESGCGKTTLLRLIAGFRQPPLVVTSGTVEYLSDDGPPLSLLEASAEDLYGIRWRRISYIMQGSMNVLNPVRRIYKSFLDFAFPHMGGMTERQFRETVVDHIGKLRLGREVLDSYPHQLSGGMRQRVAIGLATICSPSVIIADEPTTALDVVVQRETLALMKRLQRELGHTIVLVTHDLAVHANMADRIAIMYAGTIVEEGSAAEVFARPAHPYTRHLISSLPRIGDKGLKGYLKGAPPNLAAPPSGCRFHPRCPIAVARCSIEAPRLEPCPGGTAAACFLAEGRREEPNGRSR